MPLSRRDFLAAATGLAGVGFAGNIVLRHGLGAGLAAVDPKAIERYRLVVIFQQGGNDGLNMVVPRGDVAGAPRLSVYRKVRPLIGYDPKALLPLDRAGDNDRQMGLNPKLPTIHKLYKQDRVAVVQGVDYPNHSFSHFTSTDIWQTGDPSRSPNAGWIGRHLDRAGIGEGEVRAVAIGNELPLLMKGRKHIGASITSIAAARFYDGTDATADARHAAFARYGSWPGAEPVRAYAGLQAATTVGVVETLQAVKPPASTGIPIVDSMVAARILLEQPLGVETVFVSQPGYDTHAGQVNQQESLFTNLDRAVEAFHFGTNGGTDLGIGPLGAHLANRTLILTISEFGRRVGENGGAGVAGTDHGSAAPVLLIGPPAGQAPRSKLVAGLHGDHPSMGSVALPAENLDMTTDIRQLFQAVLTSWFGDPDPFYDRVGAVPGLFRL